MKGEGGAFAGLGLGREGAAEGLDKGVDDVESDAASGEFAETIGGGEAGKVEKGHEFWHGELGDHFGGGELAF